jgi:hypothetical protein
MEKTPEEIAAMDARFEEMAAFARMARSENATAFAGIQSDFRSFSTNLLSMCNEGIEVETLINKWHADSGNTEEQSVTIICDRLFEVMHDQLEWFDGIDSYVLYTSQGLSKTPEYQAYAKSKDSKVDLFPLLRISPLETLNRVLQEFADKDFNTIFGDLFPLAPLDTR